MVIINHNSINAFQHGLMVEKYAYFWIKGKCMFLYSAVSSPLYPSVCFIRFLPWQTCLCQHQVGFTSKHSRDIVEINKYLDQNVLKKVFNNHENIDQTIE